MAWNQSLLGLLDIHKPPSDIQTSYNYESVSRSMPEDRPNLKDAGHVTADGHLLVELRGLRKAAGLPDVVQFEDSCASLARARNQLWRVYLLKALGQQSFPK